MSSDLPIESAVIAELEALLSKQTRPIRPGEAYRLLADIFQLTREQRTRPLPGTNEAHWENRVRQARRKLNNANKIDRNCGHGLWALKKPETR